MTRNFSPFQQVLVQFRFLWQFWIFFLKVMHVMKAEALRMSGLCLCLCTACQVWNQPLCAHGYFGLCTVYVVLKCYIFGTILLVRKCCNTKFKSGLCKCSVKSVGVPCLSVPIVPIRILFCAQLENKVFGDKIVLKCCQVQEPQAPSWLLQASP